jgi:hypothetical protein
MADNASDVELEAIQKLISALEPLDKDARAETQGDRPRLQETIVNVPLMLGFNRLLAKTRVWEKI